MEEVSLTSVELGLKFNPMQSETKQCTIALYLECDLGSHLQESKFDNILSITDIQNLRQKQ
jgi:hypothetical protein